MNMKLTATYRRPSGFSEPQHFESQVTIVGFVWGRSKDVGRYSDNKDECAIAICVSERGDLLSIPIANLSLEQDSEVKG